MALDMKREILLLGLARDLAGDDRLTCELPQNATVATVRTELAGQYPHLAELLPKCAIAVDHRYRQDTDEIGEDTLEIAVISPVSGG